MSAVEISVLMTVYNGERYLRQAMDSIFYQTYENFELIVVDDGSTDETMKIILSYNDPRLKFIARSHLGLTCALNNGAMMSCGHLLARMDADDIAHPDRLQTQFDYLKHNSAIGLVCTDATLINQSGSVVGTHRMGRWNDDLLRQALLLRRSAMPVIHPSVMMRREVFDRLGGYRDYVCAEDHDFWLRAIDAFRFGHIAQPLIFYRIHPNGISRSRRLTQMASGVLSVVAYLVDVRIGVDIFVNQRQLVQLYSDEIESYLLHNVLPIEADYREVRELIRERRWLQGFWKGGRAVGRYGTQIAPSKRMKILRRLAEKAADRIVAEISKTRSGSDSHTSEHERT